MSLSVGLFLSGSLISAKYLPLLRIALWTIQMNLLNVIMAVALTYFNKSVNSDVYLNINIFRIVIIRKGTTKFRANPVHDHTLHQN